MASKNFGSGTLGGVVLLDAATGEPYTASGGSAAPTYSTNTGAADANTQRVVLATSGQPTLVANVTQLAGTAVSVGTGATDAGTQRVVLSTTQPTLTVGGTITSTPANPTAYFLNSAATTNAAVVKASAGNLYEVTVSNPTATPAYLKVYNKATAPTVGTDVPIFILPISGNSVSTLSWDGGKRFATGIGVALTGAIAVNDTTAAVAGVLISGSYI